MPPYGGVGYFFSWSACRHAVVLLWLRCTYNVVEGSQMAFLNKEQVERYASVAHLDLTGMTWQQKQKAINDHMKSNGIKDPLRFIEKTGASENHPLEENKETADEMESRIKELEKQLEEAKKSQPVPQVPVIFDKGRAEVQPSIEDYENVVLIASPEQRPTEYQRRKWYETMGTNKETKEVSLGVGPDSPFHGNEGGTREAMYEVRDTRKIIQSESTMPKYSCLLTYRPTKDLCAVAEYGGHRGYLWTHQRLPNVVAMLRQMGAYEEYKHFWDDRAKRKFYLGGLLCCDISFTEHMIKQIQRDLRKRKDE